MSDVEPPAPRRAGTRAQGVPWKVVLLAVLAVYAVVFLLVNSETQDVNFVFFTVRTRLIWLILLSMALGAALAVVAPRYWRSRRRP